LKRKIGLIITSVVASVFLFSATASAWGGSSGDVDVDIELSDIVIEGELHTGEVITFSGSVIISAVAETPFLFLMPGYAEAEVVAGYGLEDSKGTPLVEYSEQDDDNDCGLFGTQEAEASVELTWSFTHVFELEGDYTVYHTADGSPEYGYWVWWWYINDYLADSDYLSQTFFVAGDHPELYFQFMGLGAHGQVPYSSADTPVTPILKAIDAAGMYHDDMYRFVIPEGTEITNSQGEKALCVFINGIDGNTLSSTFRNITFSKPVTVYKGEGKFTMNTIGEWVGGEWIELGSFTEIIDYTATLN